MKRMVLFFLTVWPVLPGCGMIAGLDKRDLPGVDGETVDTASDDTAGERDLPAVCTSHDECDDGDICNGDERCDPDLHACMAGDFAENGTQCPGVPRHICLSGVCVESTCGDGFTDRALEEECDGNGPRPCMTPCASEGTYRCESCRWTCEAPDEACNGEDDDCDGERDEDFTCIRGELMDCTAACGLAGRAPCTDACGLPSQSDCIPPAGQCCVDAHCGTCGGEAAACEFLTRDPCQTQSGCLWDPGGPCTGSPSSCTLHDTSDECSSCDCMWSGFNCIRGVFDALCGDFTYEATCTDCGCTWEIAGSCSGTVDACGAFTDASSCAGQLGCEWVIGTCQDQVCL